MMNEQREKEISAWMGELLRELLAVGIESQEHLTYRDTTNVVPSKDGWKLISPPTIHELKELAEKPDALFAYLEPRLRGSINKIVRSLEEKDRH